MDILVIVLLFHWTSRSELVWSLPLHALFRMEFVIHLEQLLWCHFIKDTNDTPLQAANSINITEALSGMSVQVSKFYSRKGYFLPSFLPFSTESVSLHLRTHIKNIAASRGWHFNHFLSGVEIQVPSRAPKIPSLSASHLSGVCVSGQQRQKETRQPPSIVIRSFAL